MDTEFIPSAGFKGSKDGFVFKMGPLGLGYYADGSGTKSKPTAQQKPDHQKQANDEDDDLFAGFGGANPHQQDNESDGNDNDNAAPVDDDDEDSVDESTLTDKQRKLRALRKRMKESREANKKAIQYEQRKQTEDQKSETRIRKEEYEARKARREEELRQLGIPLSKAHLLHTATKAEGMYKKRKKKEENERLGELGKEDTIFHAYKKRISKLTPNQEEYEQHKARHGTMMDPNAVGIDSLQYGNESISRVRVDTLITDMKDQAERRSKFHRRRAFNDQADITYINDRNKAFNDKIARDFDQYTKETRQNLERGTAL